MTGIEATILVLVYAASLLLSQRLIALTTPEAQEAGFLIAAVLAVALAAAFYYRRERERPSMGMLLSVGAVLAIAAIVFGMVTQLLWESMANPAIALPAAVLGTLLLPLAVFPMVRRMFSADESVAAPISSTSAVIVAGLAVLAAGACAFIPAMGRSNVKLIEQRLPSMRISLPDWNVSERTALFEYGTVKLDDPGGNGRYMALHWTVGDPVQPDDYVKLITGGQIPVTDRSPVIVSGHEGVTYLLQSADSSSRAVVTIWNCLDDHRSLWLFSYLNGPRSVTLATHQRVLDSVHCHTGGDKPTTRSVFPNFIPPPGFHRDPRSTAMLFTGPLEQTIVFDVAVAGRSSLAAGEVPTDAVASLIKQIAALASLEGKPTLSTTHDLLGHERRIWSGAGNTASGSLVQVEVMVWYCDVQNMTFIGGYATHGAHPIQEGVDVLLPAACHEVK